MPLGESVYRKHDTIDYTYIVRSGSVTLEISSGDTLELEGDHRVFGASEFLIQFIDKVPVSRIMNAYKNRATQLMEVKPDMLKQLFLNENAGYSITKDIAVMQVWLSKLLQEKNAKLGEKERLKREYAKIYAWAGKHLAHEFKQKRYPFLEEMVIQIEKSLFFLEGSAYLSYDEPYNLQIETHTLDQFTKQFPPGSIVCQQGDEGDEMYIMAQGKVSIEMNNQQIATLSDAGSVIGELALLLSQPRSATVKAIQPTQLTVIKKRDLRSVIKAQPNFLKNIALTLSRRVLNYINRIDDIAKTLSASQEADDKKPEVLRDSPEKNAVKDLQNQIKLIWNKQDLDFLFDIYTEIGNRMNKVKKK